MKVSIVGITGYSGLELLKILSNHPEVTVVSIHATQEIGRPLSDLYPHLKSQTDLVIEAFDAESIMNKSDLVFFATPSGIASKLSKSFVENDFPVIDLSGDHRLPSHIYTEWYGKEAAQQEIIDQFTYGLAEFTDLKGKKFISNPGCYATATELALLPLVQAQAIDLKSIIVDAKSGLTGAGKGLSDSSHFVNVHDNYVTYKLNKHQHIPEIEQELALFEPELSPIQFSTSLLPVNRGIVASCYVKLKEGLGQAQAQAIIEKAYADKFFVRVIDGLPDLHAVLGTNFTDIGCAYNERTGVLTVISVIDNLIKGAAGQAVQNLNLMMGWDESLGLPVQATYL
ncbi:N-acetyl-gamma-glutamyl-phosphate reductase [Streptococcus loxodontisalivarius]|uniref:N-acetyl-gamma-glutamyl-phosphate reductase n=1 Tax=Streptococcus loxodontisalivarius TaxID=1349415 RepID=A0ABS2PU92_9STRE|nr:N-acetyl-gamma-glutamyl-phosphate reductase [Streptococcus loxodontisalivarius]MBM7643039.1 N-acetyl-gamma-glutamyl-phosphate reductase [Streptococcus loxodontisalivarius]